MKTMNIKNMWMNLKKRRILLMITALCFTAVFTRMPASYGAEKLISGDNELADYLTECDESLASPATVSNAWYGSRDYFRKWCGENTPLDYDAHFWEIVAMNSLKLEMPSGIEYASLEYEEMTAVQLAKAIFCMIYDGVDPDSIRTAGGQTVPELLSSWKQADGTYRNTAVESWAPGAFDHPFPVMAVYITGGKTDPKSVTYLSELAGAAGDFGGYSWGGEDYPGDAWTTCWALICAGITGKDLTTQEKTTAFMETAYRTARNSSDLDNCAGYISWKIFAGKNADAEAEHIAADFDISRKQFFNAFTYDPHYSTKDCARAIAEVVNGESFLESFRKKYQSIKQEKDDPKKNEGSSGSSDGGESFSRKETAAKHVMIGLEKAVYGEWQRSALTGKWSFLRDGNPVKGDWAPAYNPYGGGAAWFYFNEAGIMLTEWQKIPNRSGIVKWYYLNPAEDGWQGACYLNTVTPDGYAVDESGAWVETAADAGIPETGAGGETAAGADIEILGDEPETAAQDDAGAKDGETGERKETGAAEKAAEDKILVSISVDGSLGDAGGKHSFRGEGEVELKENASAYDALKAFAKKKGWGVTGSSSYVRGINGLTEKANGALSGWVYSVNGTVPSKAIGNYTLNDGDSVELEFVEGPSY